MPVTINGDGSITGLTAGGLPSVAVTPADGSITSAKLASNAVTSAKLHNDAVTSAHMPSNTIVQVVNKFKNDPESTSGNSHTAIPGLTVVITPTSTSNKILYSGHLYLAASGSECSFRLTRTVGGSTTNIATPSTFADDEDGTFHHGGGSRYAGHSFEFLDSPNTTSAITYGITWQTHSGTTYLNRTWDANWFHGISTLTAKEIKV